MKITNTLLLLAVAGSLAACEKSAPDTANPGEGVPETPEEPASDPLDAAGGDEGLGEEPVEGEGEEPVEGEGEEPAPE
jgi:hypothetical protein